METQGNTQTDAMAESYVRRALKCWLQDRHGGRVVQTMPRGLGTAKSDGFDAGAYERLWYAMMVRDALYGGCPELLAEEPASQLLAWWVDGNALESFTGFRVVGSPDERAAKLTAYLEGVVCRRLKVLLSEHGWKPPLATDQ